jgi:uncharacterized membrane protein
VVGGQSLTTGLTGIVFDQLGARVGRAEVTIESKAIKRKLKADEIGAFRVEIPPGRYRILVESPGFKVAKLNKVRVGAGVSEIKVVMKVKEIKYGKCPKGQICIWL